MKAGRARRQANARTRQRRKRLRYAERIADRELEALARALARPPLCVARLDEQWVPDGPLWASLLVG